MNSFFSNISTLSFFLDWGSEDHRKHGGSLPRMDKNSGFFSNQAFGRGWTRSVIWKTGQRLRRLGYDVAGEGTDRYRIISRVDSPYPWEIFSGLETSRFGRRYYYFPEVDSTNTLAHELAQQGAPEGTLIVSEYQSGGKGRLGRIWCSPAGGNIYLSLILRPPVSPGRAGQVSLLAALATARAIEEATGLKTAVKWPNDVLIEDRKVAGILSELHMNSGRVDFIICGIGINVSVSTEEFPPEVRTRAASLGECVQGRVSRVEIIQALLTSLESIYDEFLERGFSHFVPEWASRSMLEGKEVKVVEEGGFIAGRARGINGDGALLFESEDGTMRPILAGDVTISLGGE